jgi:DNA-binding response OmpR family regulator
MIPARPLEGKRILVLEDDFYLAKDEKALLEQAGAEVVGPFGGAEQGSGLPGQGHLDGAVVDINLGLGPSFDFARALKDRGVPFVFVTGYDAAVIPDELSHIERVEKPIRNRDFIAAVARLGETQPEPR